MDTNNGAKPPLRISLGKFMTAQAIHHHGFSGDTLSFYKQTPSLPDTRSSLFNANNGGLSITASNPRMPSFLGGGPPIQELLKFPQRFALRGFAPSWYRIN